ncbi:uncharacterized protein LOC106666345 [Cimex lectularius]|uniref:Uncharacterized protein n=1 Tax=Cimex lectularius TaxID=79782 RepID=A0A8I6RSR7_CIMLE|nr:uncharacterized protein LOC106666345 [Cimex lectularius]
MFFSIMEFLRKPKTFCCCMSLHTGCYVGAALYLISGILMSVGEIISGSPILKNSHHKYIIKEAFTYDLCPSLGIVFPSCLIAGLVKNNSLLVYSNACMMGAMLANNCFMILLNVLQLGHFSINYSIFIDNIIFSAIHAYFMIIIVAESEEIVLKNKQNVAILNEEINPCNNEG